MKKRILHFGQHPNHEQTYELFVSASGQMGDLFKLRKELEKKLFKTEMKNGELLGKFEGEYFIVHRMITYLDSVGWKL